MYIAKDRSREAVRPFFAALEEAGCRRIQAVAMDMNTAFDLEVRHWCAQASMVYDLFHVIAKYGREVISRVRVDTANALRKDKPARSVLPLLPQQRRLHTRPDPHTQLTKPTPD